MAQVLPSAWRVGEWRIEERRAEVRSDSATSFRGESYDFGGRQWVVEVLAGPFAASEVDAINTFLRAMTLSEVVVATTAALVASPDTTSGPAGSINWRLAPGAPRGLVKNASAGFAQGVRLTFLEDKGS